MTTTIDTKESFHVFENSLRKLGIALDDYMNTISLNPILSDKKIYEKDSDKIILKNEILSIFHKSKLHPTQFEELLLTNNIYIENEKPGDWTQLKINEVEEYMYNIKHELDKLDNDKKIKSIEYQNVITQKIGDNTEENNKPNVK
jgi:hypothetical protein